MLYGTGIVLIILIGNLLSDLTHVKDSCTWICISAALVAPLTWEDFFVNMTSEFYVVYYVLLPVL